MKRNIVRPMGIIAITDTQTVCPHNACVFNNGILNIIILSL